MNVLVVPEAALRDSNSVEMLRVWIAEKSLWCSLNVGMYKKQGIREETAWGTILADAARHIANALSADDGTDPSVVLKNIERQFAKEIARPTSAATGGVVAKSN
jgi:hypothetical protein